MRAGQEAPSRTSFCVAWHQRSHLSRSWPSPAAGGWLNGKGLLKGGDCFFHCFSVAWMLKEIVAPNRPNTLSHVCVNWQQQRVHFCERCHRFLTRRVRPYMARCLNACQEPDLRLIFRLINQWGLTLHGASRTSARNNHWVLPRGFTSVYRAARPFLRWPIRPQHGSRPGPVIRLAPVAPQLCDYKGVPSPSIFPEPTPTCSSL